MRALRVSAAALAASVALSACGSSAPVSTWSASRILAAVASNASSARNVDVQVATPSTTLVQDEDARGDLSGHQISASGEFWEIRVPAAAGAPAEVSLAFNAQFIEDTAPPAARANRAALHAVATALANTWFDEPAQVDPAATRQATAAFVSSPRLDESGTFGSVTPNEVHVGGSTTFNGKRVVPLTVTGSSEVLFVSDQTPVRALGASVPLGGDSSPVIFTFSYPATLSISVAPAPSQCQLLVELPKDHAELLALGAPGAYTACPF